MLVEALDTSSHNGLDIGPLIDKYTPAAVVVRAYQSIEVNGQGAQYSIAQSHTARARGLAVPFYGWPYRGIDGTQQANDVLNTVRKTGVPAPFVAADVETYTDGTYPTIDTVLAFLEEVERQGYRPVVYTGKFMWDDYYGGDTRLSVYPLWSAQYNGTHTLDSVTLFGGWSRDKVIGHQYSGSPVDRSVFRADFATP